MLSASYLAPGNTPESGVCGTITMSSYRAPDHHRPFIDLLDRVAVFAREDTVVYRRIRARLHELRQWFADRTAWPVVCNRELARLVKIPALTSGGHGFRWVQQTLDYELFVWLLWYAEARGEEQFLLSGLVEEVEVRVQELLGPGHIDWDIHAQRLALNRAIKGLEAAGALRRIDGDTEEWARTGTGDTLYEFTSLVRHLYVQIPEEIFSETTGAAAISELAATTDVTPANGGVTAEAGGDGGAVEEPQAHGSSPALQRLYRTLLLSPALYACADPEAFALLRGRDRRQSIATDLQETLGWDLEVTETYAALLRPSASEVSEQALFPFRGALCHVILLLCGHLQSLVLDGKLEPDGFDRIRLTPARLTALLTELRSIHGEQWGKTVAELNAQSLAETVMTCMREWDILSGPDADGQIYILPLAARFRGLYVQERRDTEWD